MSEAEPLSEVDLLDAYIDAVRRGDDGPGEASEGIAPDTAQVVDALHTAATRVRARPGFVKELEFRLANQAAQAPVNRARGVPWACRLWPRTPLAQVAMAALI